MLALLLLAAQPPDAPTTHDRTAPPAAEEETPAVDLSAVYTFDVWRNARGGLRRGWRYLDNLDVTLTVDAERALGWRGATLFAYGLYNNGASLSGDLVGDAQTVSNIETGVRAARLYEAWAEQRFAGDRASIKAGLYDLNSEFDTTGAGSLFLLSSHGIGPDLGQSGENGPSIFPNTSLAVRADYRIGKAWAVRAAAFDGVPGDPSRPARTAVKLGRGDGALLVGEVAYERDGTKAAVGAWTYTARFDAIEGGRRGGSEGVYLLVEYPLAASGLAGFARLGFADADINPIGRYAGGGLVQTGLLRRDDQAGLSLAIAGFGAPYRRASAADAREVIIEATYRTPLNGWLTVQPDLQYVINPGGDPAVADALVLGLRVEVGF